jgi:hypothetical protein
MEIDREIIDRLGVTECREEKKFFSRRNEVYLFSGNAPDEMLIRFVYKKYISGNRNNELSALTALKGKRVPRILAQSNSALCLEYIPGLTMLECMETAERNGESFSGLIDELLDFLKGFYNMMPGVIYGDVNLRNFIAAESGVYGVDLEETQPGRPETDIGRAAAFMLTYKPVTNYKREAAGYLISSAAKKLSLDISDTEKQKEKELSYMLIRRGGKL